MSIFGFRTNELGPRVSEFRFDKPNINDIRLWQPESISASACTGTSHLGCTVQWTTEQNTAFGSGIAKHSATTVAACVQECLSAVDCNGFDWNPANQPTGQCWLTGSWTGQNPAHMQGVTHYTLVRIECDSTYTQNVMLVYNSGIATQVS